MTFDFLVYGLAVTFKITGNSAASQTKRKNNG
jgi:hypothetical protein